MTCGKFRIKGGKRWKDSIGFDVRVDEMTFFDSRRRVIQEIFQYMIIREFERTYLGPFCNFLEVESNWYDTSKGFNAFQGRSFKCP